MNRKWMLAALVLVLILGAVMVVLRSADPQHRARRMNTRENATMTLTVDLPKTNSAKAPATPPR